MGPEGSVEWVHGSVFISWGQGTLYRLGEPGFRATKERDRTSLPHFYMLVSWTRSS